jgi:flavonoid 6-hydroxylase
MYGGGSETSASTITWAMAEMIKNPRVMEKVQAEVREVFHKDRKPNESDMEKLKYLKYVVKETLRLHPPGTLLLPRECGQACEIKGYDIPFKSKVIVNAWAIGRDPNHWDDPDKFYPERFIENCVDYKGNNFEFIPFGAGRRMCPGVTFGLVNVEYPLALLMYHFDWKLPNAKKNEDLDMSETFGVAVTRKDDLFLIPITYHP